MFVSTYLNSRLNNRTYRWRKSNKTCDDEYKLSVVNVARTHLSYMR